MTIKRTPSVIGPTDPDVARKLQANLKQAAVIANGRPTVSQSELILPSTTIRTSPTSITLNTSANNQPSDTVTVYPSSGNVYVSSIDQTIQQNIVNQTGVYSIIAGNGVSITSTGVSGTGNVTINSLTSGNTGNITFSGTTMTGPAGSSDSYSIYIQPSADFTNALQIYPTADNDIHLFEASGNAITLGNYGDSQISVWGPNSPNANITLQSNGNTWEFGEDGGTIFPTLTTQRGDNPSGTITGQTLLFGDSTQEAIISTPDGTSNINSSQRLVINPGQGFGGGEGGDIYLWAGRGGPTNGSGGDIKIRGGQGMADGTGGYIRIEGGDSQANGYPGYIDITGGYGGNAEGGYVHLTGGQGATAGGPAVITGGYGSNVGGDANIVGGYGGTNQGGNINITAGGSALGLAGYGNVRINSGSSNWTFDNTGNLVLPGNTFAVNYANGTQVNIGGGANLGNFVFPNPTSDTSTITVNDGSDIVINPTYGGTSPAYINVPGNINGPNTEPLQIYNGYFAGNANVAAVSIGADALKGITIFGDGSVVITANGTASWTFDGTGNLGLPSGGSIYSQSSTPSGSPGNTITLQPAGANVTTNQKLMVYPTAADGDHIHMTSGNLYETELFLGSDNLYVKLANTGNVVINSNDGNSSNAMWTFGTDGNLTFPSNLIIAGNTSVFGTDSALIQSTDGLPIIAISSGANGAIATSWVEDIANIGTSNIASVYANPMVGSKIIRIAVGQNGGPGPNLWDFNQDGNLTLPGNTFAVNYANGTQVSLDGSNISNGNSNVSIATANGNVTIAAVGNTTMTVTGTGANITGTLNVTGNVIGGNISTTGQITSTQAGNLSTGGGQLYLNGTGNNRIDFNTNGTGAPTFTTRSAGTKVVLYPITSVTNTDYALGVDSGTLWSGIPAADAGLFFRWYAGTTEVANLSGTGILTVTGNANVGNVGAAQGIFTTSANIPIIQNGNSNVTITANANISMFVTGNATARAIFTSTGANIAGTLTATGNVTGLNLISTQASGDEGGEISLAKPPNGTLPGGITIDAYQNILRFFEQGGTARGLSIDIANTPAGGGTAIGYRDIPQVAAGNVTLAATDAGKHYYSTSAGNFTLTIPNNATTAFTTGTAISIVVQSAGNVLVNAVSGVTLYMAGNSTAANRVVSNYGMATLMKVATDTWMINGTGVA